MNSRVACNGLVRRMPTFDVIGSHHAPSPQMMRLPDISHNVEYVAARVATLRGQNGNTPLPILTRVVIAANAPIIEMQSRAKRVSACQIASKPRCSA